MHRQRGSGRWKMGSSEQSPTKTSMLYTGQNAASVCISEGSPHVLPGHGNSQGICCRISFLINNGTQALPVLSKSWVEGGWGEAAQQHMPPKGSHHLPIQVPGHIAAPVFLVETVTSRTLNSQIHAGRHTVHARGVLSHFFEAH